MPAKLIKEKSKNHIPFGYKITKNVICVNASDCISNAASILERNNIGAVIVKSDNKLAGILSERDIVYRVISKGKSPLLTKVSDVMTKKVVTVDIDEGLAKVHQILKDLKVRHLPVVRNGEVVGMISNRDIMYLRKLKIRLNG